MKTNEQINEEIFKEIFRIIKSNRRVLNVLIVSFIIMFAWQAALLYAVYTLFFKQ